jgi:hypothetical protein
MQLHVQLLPGRPHPNLSIHRFVVIGLGNTPIEIHRAASENKETGDSLRLPKHSPGFSRLYAYGSGIRIPQFRSITGEANFPPIPGIQDPHGERDDDFQRKENIG